jgi:hypothetical protein
MAEGSIDRPAFWRRWRVRICLLALYLAVLITVIAMTPDGYAFELGAQTGAVLLYGTPVLLLTWYFAVERRVMLAFCTLALAQIIFVGFVITRFRAEHRVIEAVISETVQRARASQTELSQFRMDHLFELLSGSDTTSREELIELRERSQAGRAKLNDAITEVNRWYDSAQSQIARVNPKAATDFRKGIESSQGEPSTAQVSKNYFAEIEHFLDFLIESYGHFKVTKSGVIFEKSEDVERYNDFMKQITNMEKTLK